MSLLQYARGLWAQFGPGQNPFGVPNGMEENLRVIDDHLGLYTLTEPVAPGTAFPETPNNGDGQIYTDGTYATFNAGTWKVYPSRVGIKAAQIYGALNWVNAGSSWEQFTSIDASTAEGIAHVLAVKAGAIASMDDKVAQVETAKVIAISTTIPAAVELVDAAVAATAAGSASAAKVAAELARDLAQAASVASAITLAAKDTIAIGRGLVADGASFWVKPNSTDGLTRYTNYLRTSSTTQTFIADQITGSEFDSRISVSSIDGRLLVFLDGSEDQVELGQFDADGTFRPNKWPTVVSNIIVRYGSDVTDGTGDLLQILDNSEDGVYLLRIQADGTVSGKVEGSPAQIAAIAAAQATANTAQTTANAALAATGGGVIAKLQRAAMAAKGANAIVRPVLTSPPNITTESAVPAGLSTLFAAQLKPNNFYFSGGVLRAGANNGYAFAAVLLPGTAGSLGDASALDWAVEFWTDAPKMCIFTGYNVLSFRVVVDDQYASFAATPLVNAGGNVSYNVLDFGGVRKERRLRFEGIGPFTFNGVYVDALSRVWRPGSNDIGKMATIGDSHGEGAGGTLPNGSMTSIAAKLLGFESRQLCIGGTGYVNRSGGNQSIYGERIAQATAYGPDILIFEGGGNDGGFSINTFKTNCLAAWVAARAAMPNTPIVILGTLPGAANPVTTIEDALLDRFTAWADPNSVYIPIITDPEGGWIFGTGKVGATNGTGNSDLYVSNDGTHDSNAGQQYTGFRLATKIRNFLFR